MKYRILFSYMFLLVLIFPNAHAQKNSETRPNILFILSDDLGAGDLACTGHPYARTPNIDRLAENGVRFEKAYMAASWCSPSRYGLMRGQFPGRKFYATHNLMPDEPSVTSLVKKAGYSTAHFGKWHMNQGTLYSQSPGDFGIDKHFTTSSNGPGWTREEINDKYFRATSTGKYVDMVIDWIGENNPNETGKPFYINLWVSPTHSYINPTPEQLAKYDGLKVNLEDFKNPLQQEFLKFVAQYGDINKAMQAYCADVTNLDDELGRLFAFLKDNGLTENTMIVFSSDNGPGPLTGQVKTGTVVERYKKMPTLLNNVGSAGDYRDRKLSIHDGGTHVPFIVSWPAKAPKGKVNSNSIICGVDWLPTIASICGLELPDANFDGQSVKNAFLGENVKREKPIFWYENFNSCAVLQNEWKGILDGEGKFALFYLKNDPSESRNLKSEEPEKAKDIKAMIEDFLASVPTMKENKENMKGIHD